jgi:hypothetical protein
MSQVVYTEIEGQPLRWEYKGIVPRESRQEASRTPTTWSVSQTNTNQKGNTTTTAAMDVYGSNQVAEIIKTPANAVRTNQIQLYGLKAGTPPGALNVEIRKAKISTAQFTSYSPTGTLGDVFLSAKTDYFSNRLSLSLSAGDNTIITLSPQLPAGNNIIIVSVNETNSIADNRLSLKILRSDNTVVDNNLVAIKTAYQTQVLITVDSSASANQTYTLVINSNTTYTANLNIIFCVFQLSNVSFGKTNTTASVANGATTNLVSLTPGFSTGVNAIIGVVISSESAGATNPVVRILRNGIIVSESEFNLGNIYVDYTHIVVVLYLDTSPSSTTQYALQVYNNTGTTQTCEGRLLVLNVPGGNFYDSPALTESAPITKTFSTTIQSDTEALIIWAAQLSNVPTNPASVAFGYRSWSSPTFRQAWRGHMITFPILLPSRENNPTVKLSLIDPSGSWTYEYKVLAIPIRTIPEGLTKTVKAEIKFPDANVKDITFRMKKSGLTLHQTIKAELFIDGAKVGETNIASSSLTTSYQSFTITSSTQPLGSEATLLITAIGDQINTVGLQTDSSTYQTWKKYYSNSDVFDGPPLALTVNSYRLIPSDDVLASGSISASGVGTTAAWITITLSSPVVLRPNTYYAIVAYTIGGDSTNKYQLYKGGQVGDQFEHLITSSNSGGSWTMDSTTDLTYQVIGYSMTKIYNGSISNNIVTPLGKVLVALIVKAQTSGTMEFAGFDDHTLTSTPVSSTDSSQTLITVLAPDAPRLKDTAPSTTLNWEIWTAGSGLATAAYTQRYIYYTNNPVYPKDFGFGELYLIADEIPPQGLVVLNDNTAAALYNSSTTATRVDSYELFRVPVRKIEVIQEPTSGRIVMYLIGLP